MASSCRKAASLSQFMHISTQRTLSSPCNVEERIGEITVFSGPTAYAKHRSAGAGIC